MRCVVQKVKRSSVKVDGKLISEIGKGLNVLVGFTSGDDESKIDYMINKIINLRVFEDENDVMNKSVLDVNGEILLISQFTLYGDASKGNRPSYINALKSEEAEPLYDLMLKKINDKIKTYPGVFGADMEVEIINDGPATILIEK
jgi:D-tyrosyl-tRNA(Tyr) deacylase